VSDTVTLLVSADARISLRRYTEWAADAYQVGEMSPAQREEMRSYAVEIVRALLRDNPGWHPEYTARMAAIGHERRWGRPASTECTCPDCLAARCSHEETLIDGNGGHTCGDCGEYWCDHGGPPREDGHTCCGMCNRACEPCKETR
jgi:hypothetical protein